MSKNIEKQRRPLLSRAETEGNAVMRGDPYLFYLESLSSSGKLSRERLLWIAVVRRAVLDCRHLLSVEWHMPVRCSSAEDLLEWWTAPERVVGGCRWILTHALGARDPEGVLDALSHVFEPLVARVDEWSSRR